jgi:hypothetical protein
MGRKTSNEILASVKINFMVRFTLLRDQSQTTCLEKTRFFGQNGFSFKTGFTH